MTRLQFILSCVVFASGSLAIQDGTQDMPGEDDRPYGLQERVEWTTSNVRGFPEPPPAFQVERVYPQLTFSKPLGIWRIPGTNRLIVSTHQSDWGGAGLLVSFEDDPEVRQTEFFLERPEIIYGIAFHPDFEENRWVYLGCNGRSDELSTVCTKVLRFRVEGDENPWCDPESCEVVIEWPSNGHNGGDLAFGPDGMLYVTAGDGTSDSDTQHNGQDLSTIPGSLIRIDVDRPGDGRLYSVPNDNPFLDVEGARPEAWAYGFRNPWRMTFDSKTGHLWVGINGQDWWETVQLVRKGENYGWSITEGSQPFQPGRDRGPTPIVPPTIEHHHSEARSLTGGRVYYGSRVAELNGAYIYGDYSTGTIWGARHDETSLTWHERLARSSLQITGFGTAVDGELIIVDHGGGLYRLVPNDVVATEEFPRRLSDTGLFSSVAKQVPADGVIPYSVNSPLWSDGAEKHRWVAIPPNAKVGYHPRNSFEFPAGTVIVKTFSHDLTNDDLEEDVPVETRLLVKEGKEWFGYSYAWNEDRTDAILVEEQGRDILLSVANDTSAESSLTWRFPSRTECVACHTRAANYVLGLSVPQLNRDHDYDGRVDNQLRSLAHIGFFDRDELPQPVEQLERLADPSDDTQSLESRARSYLHTNCATCHMMSGGGNSSINLEYHVELDKMKAIGEEPIHDRFENENALLISPGEIEDSILFHRMKTRGKGQMPPLATTRVDAQAMELLQEWIESLGK